MKMSFVEKFFFEINELEKQEEILGSEVHDKVIDLLLRGCNDPNFLNESENERARLLSRLAWEYLRLYSLYKNQKDLNSAFLTIRRAISQYSDEKASLDFGNSFATIIRIEKPGNSDEKIILAVVDLYDELLEKVREESDDFLMLLGNRANAYRQLSELTSEMKYIYQSVADNERLLDLLPIDSQLRPSYLSNYGNALRQRYLLTNVKDDLEKAVSVQEQAVKLNQGEMNEDLFNYALSLSYLEKYKLSHMIDDLQLTLKFLFHDSTEKT